MIDVAKFASLTSLDVSNNLLSDGALPHAGFPALRALRHLDVSHNKIRLPASVAGLVDVGCVLQVSLKTLILACGVYTSCQLGDFLSLDTAIWSLAFHPSSPLD